MQQLGPSATGGDEGKRRRSEVAGGLDLAEFVSLDEGVGARDRVTADRLVVEGARVALRVAVLPAEGFPAAAGEPHEAHLLPAGKAPDRPPSRVHGGGRRSGRCSRRRTEGKR